ncbi:MAG TPA: hypothetical protein VLA88_02315 [Candidatus Saccharimonadales bacterium]|nr:hypothetical protein [Candidatus Saccharimonadales bacterium]
MPEKNQFSVDIVGDYVRLKTWGEMALEGLDAPADAALKLAQENNITKLLDDISEVDPRNASLHMQAKGMGVLWKLRKFDKVAVVFKGKQLGTLFFASLSTLHLNDTFKGFDNEVEAIAWLQSK